MCLIPRSGFCCGLAIRAHERNLSSCCRSTIMMMRWTICLMHWSLVRSVQRSSFLLGPLLFIVQRAHGKKRLTLQLVDGSTCPACRTDFGTRLRLIHHLEYSSPKCLEVVASEVPPLSLERARELAAIDASSTAQSQESRCQFSRCWCPLHSSALVQFLGQCCTFESFDSS